MHCADYRELLSALVDDELMADEVADVRQHLAGCADCARDYDALEEVSRRLKEGVVRHSAPDVLKARIRSALAQPDAFSPAPAPRNTGRLRWTTLAAAGLVIAAASSALTFGALHHGGPANGVTEALLDSHIRSLMPGHLTDVVSTNQHLVKPWFNGRLDLSPSVPNLDSLGFPLIGGRLDYIEGRPVAVVVYGRRQHVINVYSWPVAGVSATRPAAADQRGYHLVEWRNGDVEYWAVSDLNRAELDQFVKLFSR
ncbi:MAG TPA: anti-sigma factor [Gemmatimonadaceae bacterium]|nr:anti-sigma factor [Gemmatimonadaceae bacterium]